MGDDVIRDWPLSGESRNMARILLNSILLAFAMMTAPCGVEAQRPNPRAELKRMQQQLLDALLAGRRDEYAALLAPEWRVTYVDGTFRVKNDVLEEVFGGPEPLLRSGRIEDVEVRMMSDDLAVVTGRTEATPQTGATVRLRFVDVAVRREGRWIITASFATFQP
jgi:hypothetical protein